MTRTLFRYLFSQFIFLFGLIWALVGTPFLAVGVVTALKELGEDRVAVETQATVVEKLHTSGKEQSSSYRIKYVYRDAEGRKRVGESGVGWETWKQYQDGDKAAVRYRSDKPEQSRLGPPPKDRWVLPLVFGLLGSIFGVVGWCLVIYALRRAWGAMDLLRNGVLVSGTVTDLAQDLSTTINGRHPWILRYRFRGPDGMDHEGKTWQLPRKLEDRWKPGDPIPVVCDTGDVSKHEADLYGVRTGQGYGSGGA